MKRRAVVLIVTPIVLIGMVLMVLFAIPVVYYGNMLLVLALHIKPTEDQIVGTYRATTEQGSATLFVNRDHTFTELIEPKVGSRQNIRGSWKQLNLSSIGYGTQFFPYVGVLHDKFQPYAYGTPVFEKNLIGHISIEEDPDWGIYFYKQ